MPSLEHLISNRGRISLTHTIRQIQGRMMNNKPLQPREHFQDLWQRRLSRRDALRVGGCLGAVTFLGSAVNAATGSPLMGFANVAASSADEVVLPPGYSHRILMSWGDPIHADAPAFTRDADDVAQAQQFGDNTDGMELFS